RLRHPLLRNRRPRSTDRGEDHLVRRTHALLRDQNGAGPLGAGRRAVSPVPRIRFQEATKGVRAARPDRRSLPAGSAVLPGPPRRLIGEAAAVPPQPCFAIHAFRTSASFSRLMPARTSAWRSAGRLRNQASRSATVVARGRKVRPAAIARALLTAP